MVLGAAGCEGSQQAPSPAQYRAPAPVCLLTSLTPQGRFLAKESCTLWESGFLVGAPGLLPSRPGHTGPERGPGGSSSRKRGPHPGTKPRARGWRRALNTSMATPRREGPGPPGRSAGTRSDNRSRIPAGAEGPPPRERAGCPSPGLRRGRFTKEATPDRGVAHAPRTPGPRPKLALPTSLEWARRERGPASAPQCKVRRPAVEGEAWVRLPSLGGVPRAVPSPGAASRPALPWAARPLQVSGREGSRWEPSDPLRRSLVFRRCEVTGG